MKKRLLDILCCPRCLSENRLELEIFQEQHDEVIEGACVCVSCKATFPIHQGIPNFLGTEHAPDVQKAFDKQWELKFKGRFEEDNMTYMVEDSTVAERVEATFREKDLVDKSGRWFLDGGCGAAGKSLNLARKYPYAQVVAMDFTTSVYTAAVKYRDLGNLHFVQADIHCPPFRKETFHGVFSIGVLHHTSSTIKGFNAIAPLVVKEGVLNIWIYPIPAESTKMLKVYYWIRDYMFLGQGHRLPPRVLFWILRILMSPFLIIPPSLFKFRSSRREIYHGFVLGMYLNGCA